VQSHALPCEDRQHRKINCTLQNALAEKAAEKFAMMGCDATTAKS